MTVKRTVLKILRKIDKKFSTQFGFRMKDATFTKVVIYLHNPQDSSSLAVTRILFGLCMLLDVADERGGSLMESRWGQPMKCHFPLFPQLTAAPMPAMAFVYAASWIGALGITLGYKFKLSSALFTICHWYLLLVDKSFWNNHSYLFGLVGLLMTFTQANCCWSIDAYLDPSVPSSTVPYWNYFILKYQFTILYFMAGVKKGTTEWLSGYSVRSIANHWVFGPFKNFLSVSQINHLIVHWFIFVFDLTVAFWMMWSRTRTVAMVFCALFHLMNSRLFAIGMFPWVCLSTMPLFYPFHWPKTVLKFIKTIIKAVHNWYLIILKDETIICNCDKEYISDEEDNISDDEVFEKDASEETQIARERHDDSFDGTNSDSHDTEMVKKIDDVNTTGNNRNNIINSVTNSEEQTHAQDSFDDFDEENGNDELHENYEQNIDNQKYLSEDWDDSEPINKTNYTDASTELNSNITTAEKLNKVVIQDCEDEIINKKDSNTISTKDLVGSRKKLTTVAIIIFMAIQAFMPFSHFITKGYNNWTAGLYGYSWDMMVHTWTDSAVTVSVLDNDSGEVHFINPDDFTINDRWTRHGDMVHQFAKFLGEVLTSSENYNYLKLTNISIYVDIWYSLNGRFTQRMFNPKADLLKTPWSPFKEVSYLMPLFDEDEALSWRVFMDETKTNARALNNYTDFVFYAEFPGYDQEKYISGELRNVSLTILDGNVGLETSHGNSMHLKGGNRLEIPSGNFYRLINIGTRPAYYMFTFLNVTEMVTANKTNSLAKPRLPVAKELSVRFEKIRTFANVVFRNVFYYFWNRCG